MGIVTKTNDKLVIKNDFSAGFFSVISAISVVFFFTTWMGNEMGFLVRSPEIRCQRLEEEVVNCTGTPIRFFFLRGEPQAYGRALGITQGKRVDDEGYPYTTFYLRTASGFISIGRSQASAIQNFLSSPRKNELVVSPNFWSEAAPLTIFFLVSVIVCAAFFVLMLGMVIVEEYTFDLRLHRLFKTQKTLFIEKKLFKVVHQEFSLQGIELLYHEEEDSDGDLQSRVKVLLAEGKEEKVLSYSNRKMEALKEYQDLRSFLGLPPDRSISAEQTPAEKPD